MRSLLIRYQLVVEALFGFLEHNYVYYARKRIELLQLMYVAIDRQNKTFAIDWQPLQGCVRPVGVGVGGDVCVCGGRGWI